MMTILNAIYRMCSNRVFLYLFTRYIVYAIQFISLLFLAVRLGPYYYGIWGFLLMLIGYFSIINWGIGNSLNVFLVQFKSDPIKSRDYISTAFVAVGLQIVLVIGVACLYACNGFSVFDKYHVGNIFYIVCIIACLQYANSLCCNIYRVKNRLLELSIYQSAIPLSVFVCIFLSEGGDLLNYLLAAYLISHIFSFLFFLMRGEVTFNGHCSWNILKSIIGKGFFLFLYNSCFYLILTTTSFIISYFYSVEEYGMYSFSYNLGHAILLILEAFTFIIFPKLIDKFHTGSDLSIVQVLSTVRINYVVLSHGLMYVAIMLFPYLLYFFPKFNNALPALFLTSSAVLLSTNAFGYNTLLIARNKEKVVSIASVLSLFLNLILGILLASCRCLPYYCVVFSVMCSYFLFALLCGFFANKYLGRKCTIINLIKELFPISLMIPYCSVIFITFYSVPQLSFVPLLLFVLFNVSSLREIVHTFKNILINPNFINI